MQNASHPASLRVAPTRYLFTNTPTNRSTTPSTTVHQIFPDPNLKRVCVCVCVFSKPYLHPNPISIQTLSAPNPISIPGAHRIANLLKCLHKTSVHIDATARVLEPTSQVDDGGKREVLRRDAMQCDVFPPRLIDEMHYPCTSRTSIPRPASILPSARYYNGVSGIRVWSKDSFGSALRCLL